MNDRGGNFGNSSSAKVYGDTRIIKTTRGEEFEAFDRLGPKVREVMNNGMLVYSCVSTLRKILMAGGDPLDPDYDAKVAAILQRVDDQIREQLKQENEDAARTGDIGRAIARGFFERAKGRAG
jgi:hypothetical protein